MSMGLLGAEGGKVEVVKEGGVVGGWVRW